jgi:hypothetical protein
MLPAGAQTGQRFSLVTAVWSGEATSTPKPSRINRRYAGCFNPQALKERPKERPAASTPKGVGGGPSFSLECFTGNMTVKQRRVFHGKHDGETTP